MRFHLACDYDEDVGDFALFLFGGWLGVGTSASAYSLSMARGLPVLSGMLFAPCKVDGEARNRGTLSISRPVDGYVQFLMALM